MYRKMKIQSLKGGVKVLIKNIIIENVGPIKRINIELPINEDNTPQPIIIVGENGKGKSTLISSIVDSLFEYSKQAFNDVVPKSFENQNPYFKISSYINTTVGEKYSFSFINFINNYQYIDKSGEISFEECKEKTKGILTLNSNWDNIGNVKNCTRNKSYFEDEFVKKAICYFPPNRYEKPIWMNEDALFKGIFNIEGKINGKLNKPILIENVNKANINWLLDIIADSRVDVCEKDGKLIAQQNPLNVMLLNKARKNVEEILSQILDKEVKFGLNWRNSGASRFNIMDKDNNMVIPSLEALSTGETALFNIFSTIIRYADYSDINRSINLNEIEGLVIIDEIDLHLHSKIQANILPKLLKKFPKVQFIVTTHSPLFVLGMEETYGKDN